LLNAFLGYERAVVSDIPGTTRDSINEIIKFENTHIQLPDTAGIRKKSKKASGVEFFSLRRSIQSIEKCDVVIHLVDAEGGFSETDKKIADEINRARKPFIIALNKWDKVPKDHKTFEEHRDRLLFKFYKAADAPVISISALEKQRIHRLLQTALKVHEDAGVTMHTPVLNRLLETLQKSGRLPKYGQSMKIYYATQIGTRPPLFRFYVNNPDLFKIDVIRFFEKELQKSLNISGVPVNIVIEGKKKKPAQ
jgi:GTP-binding protein